MTGLLRLEAVTARYGRGPEVLGGIDLDLGAGLHVLLGPNGSGKTTFFRVVAGILPPASGRLSVLGRDPYAEPGVKRALAYSGHRAGLSPGLTVLENLEFWARALGFSPGSAESRCRDVAERAGVGALLEKSAASLSRGQSQRVVICRALLADPLVLLLDEPTTGLDPSAAVETRQLLRELASDDRLLLCSTHNLYEASELADTVVLLRDGHVVAQGSLGELRARFGIRRAIVIEVQGDPRPVLTEVGATVSPHGNGWLVETDDVGRVLASLAQSRVELIDVHEAGAPLEAIYAALEHR